ncbi:wings apart-like protein homolog isoform X2 [Phycodurus eques]|uniref:wings apart-like protein homolog isoform X2 n=1 Tax=Phycodurus eques TaxID=693459 RepID=UPI002ACE128C|nr:wings apart-like protein homolog isoform X2 [Phycodurus eques]
MTSRFGKTYSRKGGVGPSKFDEVVSTKRGTLSTKWGDTTYKARVGSKRAGAPKGPSAPGAHKRARPGGDGSDDPFGFDSDEESKPVSSRGGKSSPAKAEPHRAEKLRVSPDSGNWSSFHEGLAAPTREMSRSGGTERPGPFFGSVDASEVGSSSLSSEKRHSYAWYQNASESDKKPLAQTATLKTFAEAESAYGSWDALMGFRPPSPSREPCDPDPALSWTSAADELPSPPRLRSPADGRDPDGDFGFETADRCRTSTTASPLVRNSKCRTYRGPGKQSSSKDPDCGVPPSGPLASASGGANETATAIRGGGMRDYTVLHPSSASMCNVTNQAGGGEEFKGEGAPASGTSGANSSGAAERLDAAWQRKKAEQRHASPNQSRSKKGPKADLFGFDQVGGRQDDEDAIEGDDDDDDGSSKYKIKYFGFDDMSDSDGAGGDDDCAPKVRMRVKMAAVAEEKPPVAVEDSHDDDPFRERQVLERCTAQPSENYSETQYSRIQQESTRQFSDCAPADVLNFSEDDLRVVAAGPRRPPRGKTADKNQDTHRRIFSAQKKSPTKAVYNARHWTLKSEEEPIPSFMCRPPTTPVPRSSGGGASADVPSDVQKDDGVFKAPPPPPKVTKCINVPDDPYQDTVTALKCRKEHKELYTVVQHVKHFNDVVEFGENQEFTDDFEYLAAGLKSGQPLNTRCLSVISLATRCAMPSFRMHLRARGKVAQVFKTLNDAPQHPNLAMCTASLMYILSRDRLNMDLDRSCLDLMIRLLELDQDQGGGAAAAAADSASQLSAREICKMKEKIRKLCDTVHNKHLDLQNITTGHLAMETLLSLTSKRAGDWFKEELRLLGGLDHIVDKVKECVDNLKREDDEDKLVSSLWGAERCLRVLDSVTVHNTENQSYLIAYKDSSLIVSCAEALRHCEEMIRRHSTVVSGADGGSVVAKAVENCMRAVIGVLLNLTHDNEWGSTKTGEQDDLIPTALNCVLRVPQYFPQEKRFDIRVLGLGLLINLVEYSARNRYCLMEMEMEGGQGPCDSTVLLVPPHQQDVVIAGGGPLSAIAGGGPLSAIAGGGPLSAIAALVQLFLQRERAAVLAEAQTDDLIKEPAKPADKSGEWRETGGEIQWVANDNHCDSDAKEKGDKDKKEEEDGELDLNKALQHAGKHMEDSIVASYTALLLGCLCQGSPMNVTTVRENLPQGDFSIMTDMLKKFLNFMNLTCDVGTAGQKSIARVIDYLEHC